MNTVDDVYRSFGCDLQEMFLTTLNQNIFSSASITPAVVMPQSELVTKKEVYESVAIKTNKNEVCNSIKNVEKVLPYLLKDKLDYIRLNH